MAQDFASPEGPTRSELEVEASAIITQYRELEARAIRIAYMLALTPDEADLSSQLADLSDFEADSATLARVALCLVFGLNPKSLERKAPSGQTE